jgi:hypothetical protein
VPQRPNWRTETDVGLDEQDYEATQPYRPYGGLSEEEVDALVARVTRRVVRNFYQEVGRTVVMRVMQAIGMGVIAVSMFLAGSKMKIW